MNKQAKPYEGNTTPSKSVHYNSRLCHRIGTTVPPYWHGCATALARPCHRSGKSKATKVGFLLSLLFCSAWGFAQQTDIPVPKPHQLKWHEAEMGAVFHYDLHVFDGICYGQGNNRINPIEDYNIFNPTELNTDQWVQAAKAAGCKFAILTATHETGFGLWQSDANPYCLKAVKWRDGKGDIVRDFVNSCRKYGIQPGIYIGIRWNSLLGIHNFKAEGEGEFARNRQAWYKRLCEKMVTELCTRYGDLYMIWFDGGADDPRGNGPDVEPIVNKYQPDCLFYHNMNRADLRWGGSESGTVGYPCWSTFPYPYSHGNATDTQQAHTLRLKHGDKEGKYWVPAMADTPLRGANGRHEWFWEPDDENNIYPVETLMEMYEKSVGRNATLIVGLTPDPTGLIPAGDVQRLKEWGEEINRRFSAPLARAEGRKKSLILDLGASRTVSYCIIQENIKNGERIRQYKVDVKVNGKWQTVCTGQSVGHKRIAKFAPVKATALRLTVTEATAQPDIINFSAYSAPNPFAYEKGKTFENTPAYRMEKAIDLTNLPASPILYEKQTPENQSAVVYNVVLPSYVRGVFFSRDSRPGDYEWPNNTNRLLPWMFGRLEEITRADYPGIPSNSRPSRVGDALLLQLADSNYLYIKAVSGTNSLSWFQVNGDGSLSLYLSTLGEDPLSKSNPLVVARQSGSVYDVLRDTYEALGSDREAASLRKRTEKTYYEAFDYLGWCTWEHYHADIDESKILRDMDTIESSGIPVRYVLIDDGHIANSHRRLTSLQPDKQRFPNGWSNIMKRKQEQGIKWIGVWHSLSGYWEGISPLNDFPEKIRKALYPSNGGVLPGPDREQIHAFYRYYVQTLKSHGFDFLKVDNQSFTLPLYMGGTSVVRRAKECNLALEEETHRQQVGLMNCMAHNVLNTDHTLHSAVTRVSIDYKKYDEDMAKSHLFQSYTNTLLLGQTVWPDHDMFHSSDTVCGSLMARSKALSGGPVYLSDAPAEFVKEHILPLIDGKGRIFRPNAPAVPAPESILTNPLRDGTAYRVFAPTGNEAVSLICYNLNTRPEYRHVTARISPEDYTLRTAFDSPSAGTRERILLYDWKKQQAEELTGEKTVGLNGFTDELFHLCPIRNGWAVVGIQEKYLSPATVDVLSASPRQIKLKVRCAGTLRVWAETDGKGELRSIPVDAPREIVINK